MSNCSVMNTLKSILTLLVFGFAALSLSSCNTYIGATRDLQVLGTGLENKAEGKTWQGGDKFEDPTLHY